MTANPTPGLRDRIAEALAARVKQAVVTSEFDLADAVLAVLPPAADIANLCAMYEAASAREHELIEERDRLLEAPPVDICRPVEVGGEVISVRGSGDFTEQEQEFAAEIIRAAKRRYATEHPDVDEEQPECPASKSGYCLFETQTKNACDTETDECVYEDRGPASQPGKEPQP